MNKPKLPPVKLGSLLWKDLNNLPRKVSITSGSVEFKAPSRVNISILDFTEMRPNIGGKHCNSGSISFGVGLYSPVKVTPLKAPNVVIGGRKKAPLLSYFAEIMKELTQYGGGFRIEAKPVLYQHVGLGSTACLTCTLLNALNIVLGKPFTDRELVKIGAFNYVEEGQDRKLYPGQSTGASGWVALKGGFNIITSEAELVYRTEIPEEYKVIVGIPKIESAGVAESDIEIPILERLSFHDRFNSAKICHWTLTKMIPALAERDFETIGNLAWEMLLAGTKGVPAILAHGTCKPLECLLELRQAGATIPFMSSVGPGMVALTRKDRIERIKKVYEKHNCEILELEVDNEGGKVI